MPMPVMILATIKAFSHQANMPEKHRLHNNHPKVAQKNGQQKLQEYRSCCNESGQSDDHTHMSRWLVSLDWSIECLQDGDLQYAVSFQIVSSWCVSLSNVVCVHSHPLLLKSRPAKNQIMYFMYFRTPSREPQKVCTVYTFFSLCIIQILRRPPQRVMMEHKINPARLPMMSDKGPVKLTENSNKKSQIPNSPRKTSIDHDEFAERSPPPHYRSRSAWLHPRHPSKLLPGNPWQSCPESPLRT